MIYQKPEVFAMVERKGCCGGDSRIYSEFEQQDEGKEMPADGEGF